MADKFQAPKGTYDVLPYRAPGVRPPPPWTLSSHWLWIEKKLRDAALGFGFQEIRTPVFESAALFARTAGDGSDVVSKEMYLFEDRGNRELALRPEGTAPAARALIEAGLLQPGRQARVFYLEPMFRYERPQAGRFRQHTQFGVEWFGASAAEADAECILLMWRAYESLGLKGLSVRLNSLGTREDRLRYREKLVQYLSPHVGKLSEESRIRLERNPLRILDSKSPQDIELLQNAPQLLSSLSPESTLRFERVQALLHELQIPVTVSPQLVRGFDYYTHTVWEVVAEGIGAQGSVGGGGRYDPLVQELGGPGLSGLGFGVGLERLMAVMALENLSLGSPLGPEVLVVPLEESLVGFAMKTADQLRQGGLRVELNLDGRRLKHLFGRAAEEQVQWVVLVGSEEQELGCVSLKDLVSGTQQRLSVEAAYQLIQERSATQNRTLC